MKIIVESGKKKNFRKINNDTFLCVLPSRPILLSKIIYKKFIKSLPCPEENSYYKTKTLDEKLCKKLNKITNFTQEKSTDIFLLHIEKIIKTLNTGAKMKICIFSDLPDERIYKLCDRINPFTDILYLVTQNEDFYDKISSYTMENHGLVMTLKQFSESVRADINIILNSNETDFSKNSGYSINLSDKNITAEKTLYDIIPIDAGDFSGIEIKKCQFLNENCENFNLIWRNYQKSVDKFKK